MAALPRNIIEAWDRRKGPVVLATVNGDGVPNIIYATCVSRYDEETIVIADNFFDKTRKNIQAGGPGSLLFITESSPWPIRWPAAWSGPPSFL
jgi:predicted pyridoxine 5'-phosphate oxidase superfamily flavin-nucleotide-binding protein